MTTRRLGVDGPVVGPISFGAMGFAGYYGAADADADAHADADADADRACVPSIGHSTGASP